MDTINTRTLLVAINTQNTAFIDNAINKGISLRQFCAENAIEITGK